MGYKLRMMGINIDEPAIVFGDNKFFSCNTTAPASTLKKKSNANAIAYHFICEGVACDEWWTAHVNTDKIVADLFTKPLSGPKQAKFVWMILHHIFPEKWEYGQLQERIKFVGLFYSRSRYV